MNILTKTLLSLSLLACYENHSMMINYNTTLQQKKTEQIIPSIAHEIVNIKDQKLQQIINQHVQFKTDSMVIFITANHANPKDKHNVKQKKKTQQKNKTKANESQSSTTFLISFSTKHLHTKAANKLLSNHIQQIIQMNTVDCMSTNKLYTYKIHTNETRIYINEEWMSFSAFKKSRIKSMLSYLCPGITQTYSKTIWNFSKVKILRNLDNMGREICKVEIEYFDIYDNQIRTTDIPFTSFYGISVYLFQKEFVEKIINEKNNETYNHIMNTMYNQDIPLFNQGIENDEGSEEKEFISMVPCITIKKTLSLADLTRKLRDSDYFVLILFTMAFFSALSAITTIVYLISPTVGAALATVNIVYPNSGTARDTLSTTKEILEIILSIQNCTCLS